MTTLPKDDLSELIHSCSFMFPQEPPVGGGNNLPVERHQVGDDPMYYVDFGPFFAQGIQKVLRYRNNGMFCELMFWQDEYRF